MRHKRYKLESKRTIIVKVKINGDVATTLWISHCITKKQEKMGQKKRTLGESQESNVNCGQKYFIVNIREEFARLASKSKHVISECTYCFMLFCFLFSLGL